MYSSFKVKIASSNFKKAMDPKVWPLGAIITRFLYPRKKKGEEIKSYQSLNKAGPSIELLKTLYI